MRPVVLLLAGAGFILATGAATAACPDTTASIAKDGSHAPMETSKNAPGVTSSKEGTTTNTQAADESAKGNDEVSKNGRTMPLANKQGGGDTNQAMSEEDVQAQQKGDKTAAAQAMDDACKN